MPVAELRRRGGGRYLRTALRDHHRVLAARGMELSAPRDRLAHLLPHARSLPPLAHPAALLLGDAAAMINPFSGEGIAYALRAAVMAAAHVAERTRSPSHLQAGLAAFERDFRRRFRAHYRSALMAQRLVRSPAMAGRTIRAAARDERLRRELIALLFAEERVRAPLAGRLALDLLRPALI